MKWSNKLCTFKMVKGAITIKKKKKHVEIIKNNLNNTINTTSANVLFVGDSINRRSNNNVLVIRFFCKWTVYAEKILNPYTHIIRVHNACLTRIW